MSNPLKRYQKLALKGSLSTIHRYPLACKELSFILREAYSKLPKNVQTLIFQDTLTAFRLLPEMQTCSPVSAAHLLLQSAEAALPKQKRNSAVTEFKRAMVAHKRRSKPFQLEKGSIQLPQDVLVHIFSFLDIQSIISVGLVCWSWNLAASDNHLWQVQYSTFFGRSDNIARSVQEECVNLPDNNWREAFKIACKGSSTRLTRNRGYCECCKTIVWLCNVKCPNKHCGCNCENQQIKPLSHRQVVEFLLDETYSSDSEYDSSDSDQTIGFWSGPLIEGLYI